MPNTDLDIGGRMFTLASDDRYLDAFDGVFEPHTVRLLRAVATGSRTALDIGANIGVTALLLSQMADEVHAFEASPSTYQYLAENVRSSGLDNVATHDTALGETPHETDIMFAPNNRSGGFVADRTRASAGHIAEGVSVRTLDTEVALLGLSDIDFVKMDVEGYEGHVLNGATGTLAEHQPIVTLELNHWCLNAFHGVAVPDFFDQLRATFPILRAVDDDDWRDLHDADARYEVMYRHIIEWRYRDLIGAFDGAQLAAFDAEYGGRPLTS